MNWIDAPHALTEIRNSFVHPEIKNRDKKRSVVYETWQLGQWLLELSILSLCGYSSTYANRLSQKWVGEIEKVPWFKAKS